MCSARVVRDASRLSHNKLNFPCYESVANSGVICDFSFQFSRFEACDLVHASRIMHHALRITPSTFAAPNASSPMSPKESRHEGALARGVQEPHQALVRPDRYLVGSGPGLYPELTERIESSIFRT